MKKHFQYRRLSMLGVTLFETVVSVGILMLVSTGIYLLLSQSSRMTGRVIATNMSHLNVRKGYNAISDILKESGSAYVLINRSGSGFVDVQATGTTTREPMTNRFLSNRANGVRFRRFAGGPFLLNASTTPTSISLTFRFDPINGQDVYLPQPGDRLVLPLVAQELAVLSVTTQPTATDRRGTIVVDRGVGFTLTPSTTNLITGRFYRSSALAVVNNSILYYPSFTLATPGSSRVLGTGVRSVSPFALVVPTSTTTVSSGVELHAALGIHDQSRARWARNSALATINSVISPRLYPTPIASFSAN
jgi:hypothetical protein